MDNIYNNILSNGSIIASPSKEPDYNFHWTRDSAIVINSLIEKNETNLDIFENFINIELEHIKFHAAEPKFNIDGSPYLGEWGRPQNDGPALRGIVCLKLIKILPFRLPSLIEIINNDLEYTIKNINSTCFDLWEEINGYHLYTRLVQYMFLYKITSSEIKNKFIPISKDNLNCAFKNLTDHFAKDSDKIYSSYSKNGKILENMIHLYY